MDPEPWFRAFESGLRPNYFIFMEIHVFQKNGSTQEVITHIRLLWDKRIHSHMYQLMTLLSPSTNSFRWSSLRYSPSVIQCAPGVGLRSDPVPYLYV